MNLLTGSLEQDKLFSVVGSFGLVTVAPFTALTSGMLLARRRPGAGRGPLDRS